MCWGQDFRFAVQASISAEGGEKTGVNAAFHFLNDAHRHAERDKGGRVCVVGPEGIIATYHGGVCVSGKPRVRRPGQE